MKARLLLLLRLFTLWLALQVLSRPIFMVYQAVAGQPITLREAALVCLHGLRMDLSLVGYVMLLLSLLLVILLPAPRRVARPVLLTLNALLSVACIATIVADWEIYRNWQFRIDLTPFIYLTQPAEAVASTPILSIVLLLLGIAALVLLFNWVAVRWVWPRALACPPARWWHAPVLVLVGAAMILPIRGSLDVAPMNVSSVAFSNHVYANHAAINPTWNLIQALIDAGHSYSQQADFLPEDEALRRFQRITEADTVFPKLLRIPRPNVLILLMESQSAKFSRLWGVDSCTPALDSVAATGLAFSRLYAASTRSEKGLVGVWAGYPAQGRKAIMRLPRKLAQLNFFPRSLDSLGYHSAFYYGGNAEFANMRTGAYLAGFQRVVEQADFPASLRGEKWGVHDEYVYERLLRECDTARGPFLKMYFTLSNHEPFDLPHASPDPEASEEQRMRATVRYADRCMAQFLHQAKQRPWWDSTLVVILADHGHRLPGGTPNHLPERYHIPMVWTGGALAPNACMEVSTVGSQIDLAATLLAQLGLSHSRFPFSRNILAAQRGCAMVVYNNGFGWITDSAAFTYDFDAQRIIHTQGACTDSVQRDGEAFFQTYLKHYLGL